MEEFKMIWLKAYLASLQGLRVNNSDLSITWVHQVARDDADRVVEEFKSKYYKE